MPDMPLQTEFSQVSASRQVSRACSENATNDASATPPRQSRNSGFETEVKFRTTAEIVDEWLLSQRSAQTEETYRRLIREWLGWCTGKHLDPRDARRRDIDAYRKHLHSRDRVGGPISDATESQHLSALSSFYRYAAEEHDLEYNPVARVKRPRLDNAISRRHFLTLEEARAVLAASITTGPRASALVHLLLATGARVSEICNADISSLGWDSDGNRALLVVRKGGRRGDLPILPHYWAVIDTYLGGRVSGPILLTERGRMCRQTAYRTVRAVAYTVAPTKMIGPHSLRHTAATLALDDGTPIQEVQGMLGHSDSRTTSRYDRHGHRRGGPAFRSVANLLGGGDADA